MERAQWNIDLDELLSHQLFSHSPDEWVIWPEQLARW
jgi:hypothetical protein